MAPIENQFISNKSCTMYVKGGAEINLIWRNALLAIRKRGDN